MLNLLYMMEDPQQTRDGYLHSRPSVVSVVGDDCQLKRLHPCLREDYIILGGCLLGRNWILLGILCSLHSRGSITLLNVAMADDGYSSTAWESTDNSDPNTNQTPIHGLFRPNNPSLIHESATAPALSLLPVKSSSPPPRSSSDSLGRSSTSRWRDSVPVTIEHKDAQSALPADAISLVEPSFDENVLRVLCELDVSILQHGFLPLMSPRHDSVEFRYCWIGSNRAWCRVA